MNIHSKYTENHQFAAFEGVESAHWPSCPATRMLNMIDTQNDTLKDTLNSEGNYAANCMKMNDCTVWLYLCLELQSQTKLVTTSLHVLAIQQS